MSGDELFDVVDERDNVIGQRTRREVHQTGLRHRAVHVLIYNAAGKLFLQKRSMLKDCFPGTWDSSASGHLAPGESYDACALREVEEELGLRLSAVPERLFKIEARPETGQEFVWVYRTRSEGPFRLQVEEVDAGDWFSPQEVSDWLARKPSDFASGFALIWQMITAAGR